MKAVMKVVLVLTLSISYMAYSEQVYSLYTDHRAMKNDDILTVIIVEEAKAGSKSGTNTSKGKSYGVDGVRGTGALDFAPEFGVSGGINHGFEGDAGTSREGNLAARVSARVTQVLDNGNLMIEGSKVVEINNEKEIIKVSGVVRPEDIGSNNIVYSYNVADAQINYSGKGTVHEGSRPGLLSRFLNWIF
ncbi:MAG: flagellar basal body L-ring protein FlgH [Chitinispirillaceae bacterium]